MGRRSRTAIAIRGQLAEAVRAGRHGRGWTQARVGEQARLSRQMIGRIESASVNLSIDVAGVVLDSLGIDAQLLTRQPFSAGRQRDPAHATCSVYAQRRLESAGWLVLREVEVHHGRSHGWIDLLAYDPRTSTLLVVEVKTEIDDVGRIERTITWYQREAWAIARRQGWKPARVIGWLLVLATDANDERIRANRDVLRAAFPGRGPGILASLPASALAMVDPRSRRKQWLLRTRVDGRRSPAPYRDYADFMRVRRAGRRPRAACHHE